MNHFQHKFNNQDFSFLPQSLQIGFSKWSDYTFSLTQAGEKIEVTMMNKDEVIAYGYFYEDKKYLDIGYMDVEETYQRKGITTLIFKSLEFMYKKPLENNDLTTDSGAAFWKQYV